MLLLRIVASGKAFQALHIVGVEHSGDREVLYVVVGIAFQQFRQCAGRHDFDFYVFAARQCARGADTQAADEREDFVHTVGLFLVSTKVNIFFGVKRCNGINS